MATLVQGVFSESNTTSSTTIAKSFNDTGSNVTAGNAILVLVKIAATGTASAFSATVTDTLGNTYTQAVATSALPTSDHSKFYIFYAKNISGGACTVTATWADAKDRRQIYIMEVSGLDTTAPLETTASSTGTSNAPNAGNLVTAGGGFLLAAVIADDPASGSPGSGWTGITTTLMWTYSLLERRAPTTGGTYAADFSTASSTGWTAIGAAFKDAAGGSSSVPPRSITRSFAAARAANY